MTLAKQKRPVRSAGRAVVAKASSLVHMNQEIADAANDEDGRDGPQDQEAFTPPIACQNGDASDYCSVQTLVVLTADSASTLVL